MSLFPIDAKRNEVLYHRARNIIHQFLEKRILFDNAAEQIYALFGNCDALNMLSKVLQMDPTPLPFPENYRKLDGKRHKTRSWSGYEDMRLIAGIYKYGIENWTSISKFVGNGRTRSQCSQRWYRCLNPSISKTQWSKEEEDMLMELVMKNTGKSWNKIASKMGNRSDVQCRYKYMQLVKDRKQNNPYGVLVNADNKMENIPINNNSVGIPQQAMPNQMGFPMILVCDTYQQQGTGNLIGYQQNNTQYIEFPYYQSMYVFNQMPNHIQQQPYIYPNKIKKSVIKNHKEKKVASVQSINTQNEMIHSVDMEQSTSPEKDNQNKIPESSVQIGNINGKTHEASPNVNNVNEINQIGNNLGKPILSNKLNSPAFKGSLYSVY